MLKNTLIIIILLFLSVQLYAQESARPWLGVGIDKGKVGVFVENAIAGTPAEKAGILANDEILSIDGNKVRTPRELIDQITSKGIGHTVNVEILRNSKTIVKKITLVGRPDMLNLAKNALLNKKAPALSGVLIETGKKFDLEMLKGEVVVLEFWATWCPACIANYPKVMELSGKYRHKVKVVTVSSESVEKLKAFTSKRLKKISYSNESKIQYVKVSQDISAKYFTNSIPMFFLINKKGEIVDLVIGGGEVIDRLFDKAINL